MNTEESKILPEDREVVPVKRLQGEITLPGDKSVCHRAIILGALAEGALRVENFSWGEDNLSTVRVFRQMGVRIENSGPKTLTVHGVGLNGLQESEEVMDAGNSGTTMRLLTGLLAGQKFYSVMTGDASLRTRPMGRVISPLREMGAEIRGRRQDTLAPLAIVGRPLKGVAYRSAIASAQVKSAILLAGLYAEGKTEVAEPQLSRDHTERMMQYLGIPFTRDGLKVAVAGGKPYPAKDLKAPGDFSSAAFFLVAALTLPDSELYLRGVGLNPTRIGLLKALKEMGGEFSVENQREEAGEPCGDIRVRSSRLRGVKIPPELAPDMIDEFPIFCVAAALAEGVTEIRGVAELRVKETDRIATMAAGLTALGVNVKSSPDGMDIEGAPHLHAGELSSHGDHRVAMALTVAALNARGISHLRDVKCIETSFPGFFDILYRLTEA